MRESVEEYSWSGWYNDRQTGYKTNNYSKDEDSMYGEIYGPGTYDDIPYDNYNAVIYKRMWDNSIAEADFNTEEEAKSWVEDYIRSNGSPTVKGSKSSQTIIQFAAEHKPSKSSNLPDKYYGYATITHPTLGEFTISVGTSGDVRTDGRPWKFLIGKPLTSGQIEFVKDYKSRLTQMAISGKSREVFVATQKNYTLGSASKSETSVDWTGWSEVYTDRYSGSKMRDYDIPGTQEYAIIYYPDYDEFDTYSVYIGSNEPSGVEVSQGDFLSAGEAKNYVDEWIAKNRRRES